MSKPVLEIDGATFITLEEFFDVISRVLIPGSPRELHLDAFNDILRGGFGTPAHGFILIWKNSAISRERLGYPETIRQLRKKLKTCNPSNRQAVKEDLARAQNKKGPTVFDRLVEIIQVHSSTGAEPADGVELVLD